MQTVTKRFQTFEDLEAYKVNGYLHWLRERKTGQSLGLREEPISYGDSDEDLEQWLASLPL